MGTSIDRASFEAYQREEDSEIPLEAVPNSASTIDFSTFATDCPERLLPILDRLRPEFQELFMEYYVLHKDQYFLGHVHGCIQTRIWQTLRIIEKAIGALLVLGSEPNFSAMQENLVAAGLDQTEFGSLAALIAGYAKTRDYAAVAKAVGAPVPAIRKIFRPAIKILSASHNLKVVAVGAYLRNLTHQASLRKKGLSKRALKRLKRTRIQHFVAPASNEAPLMNFGRTSTLGDTPWCMFEASWESENNLLQLRSAIQHHAKKIFGKKAAQIFIPADKDGKLLYGYVFARCAGAVRGLLRIPGISSISTQYHDGDDSSSADTPDARAVQIADSEVQQMIARYHQPKVEKVCARDFVCVLSGPASKYCGTVKKVKGNKAVVEVNFPTQRKFIVHAHISSLRKLDAETPQRAFWGVRQ